MRLKKTNEVQGDDIKMYELRLQQMSERTLDIEEELEMTAGSNSKPYIALKEISQDDFEITNQLREKIEKIFE